MAEKENCAICMKTIAKDPVPYYQAKDTNNELRMWRHEDCPKVKKEE